MKLDKHFYNKLTKEFNSYAEQDDWRKERTIQIEFTSFFKRHLAERGLNHNESGLLDFGSQLIDAKAIHFAYDRRFGVHIYIRSIVHTSSAGTYIEWTKNGKTESLAMYDHQDEVPWRFKDVLTKQDIDLFQSYSQKEIKDKLNAAGFKILVFFRFNTELRTNIPHHHSTASGRAYLKRIRNGIEMGGRSSGTYNSLPYVIRIQKVHALKVTKLVDLGIEDKGYYSHDFKCKIPSNQAEKAKQFFKSRKLLGNKK